MSSPTPLSTLTQRTLFTAAAVLTASCGLYLMSYAYFAAKELLIGSRSDVLPEHKERVLILGASSPSFPFVHSFLMRCCGQFELRTYS
jgi:hypothetical protein